jgi:YVTN family beta-propeller protein
MPSKRSSARRGVRTIIRAASLASLVAACSAAPASSPFGTGSPQPTVGSSRTAPPSSPAVASYPPLPTPTPLPAAAAAGKLSSIKATRIPLGYPAEISAVGQTVWAQAGSGLARFSVATNHGVLVNPGIGAEVDNLLATATAVWLADFGESLLVRLDPTTGAHVAEIPVGAAEGVIDVGATIWVTNHHEGSVSRIDPNTNSVIDTTVVGQGGSNGPQQLGEGAGSVWVGEGNTHSVIRMDPATGKIIWNITVPDEFTPCGGILATDSAVWITACHEAPAILRIDPATNTVVTTIALDAYAQDLVLIGGSVWVAVAGIGKTHELERINPKSNTVDRRIDVPGFDDVYGSAIAGGDLWVSNGLDAIFRFPLTELGGP